jgi:hypothetical protein
MDKRIRLSGDQNLLIQAFVLPQRVMTVLTLLRRNGNKLIACWEQASIPHFSPSTLIKLKKVGSSVVRYSSR